MRTVESARYLRARGLRGDLRTPSVCHPARLLNKQPSHTDVERLLRVGRTLTVMVSLTTNLDVNGFTLRGTAT